MYIVLPSTGFLPEPACVILYSNPEAVLVAVALRAFNSASFTVITFPYLAIYSFLFSASITACLAFFSASIAACLALFSASIAACFLSSSPLPAK